MTYGAIALDGLLMSWWLSKCGRAALGCRGKAIGRRSGLATSGRAARTTDQRCMHVPVQTAVL